MPSLVAAEVTRLHFLWEIAGVEGGMSLLTSAATFKNTR
jgi:hypothetical protein